MLLIISEKKFFVVGSSLSSKTFYQIKIKLISQYARFNTVKIMILSRYRYRPVTVPLPSRYRPITVPLPSRYHFLQALPIVHHRDTIVPDRPSPSTVPHRPSPFLAIPDRL